MKINEIKSLTAIHDLRNRRVVLRLDLNVPCESGKVSDDYRIRRVLPTLDFLKKGGAKTVIISHIEGSSGTLKPVFDCLKERVNLVFSDNLEKAKVAMGEINPGGFVLVENIRNEPGEKTNDHDLAVRIAGLGDVYVNEAFSASHREHASIIGVPKIIPGYAGLVFREEIVNLSTALNPARPSLFILGGAKFETKLPLVNKFLDVYDYVFIGGALANDIFKAKGLSIGVSEVSKKVLDLDPILKSEKLYLPFDVLVKTNSGPLVKRFNDISSEDKVVDSGPKTGEELFRLLSKSKFVLWNGPLGQYEEGFSERTEELARMIIKSGVKSTIGGGDTVAAAEKTGLLEKFSFVSTGGGAMLEFLASGTLPGIKALENSL